MQFSTTHALRALILLLLALPAVSAAERDCRLEFGEHNEAEDTRGPIDHHEVLICEIQRRCDPTRNSFERNNCQAQVIQATHEFKGRAGTGFLSLLRTKSTTRRGAILAVGGFSPQLEPHCYSDFDNPETPIAPGTAGLTVRKDARGTLEDLGELWELGFDVYGLRWCDASDYIQRNAFTLQDAIAIIQNGEFPSSVEPLEEDDELIVIGASMGGLVSRYALSHAETNGLLLGVDLFISFDSPQQGAYLPIGIQHFAELLDGPVNIASLFRDDLDEAVRDLRGAETPAARQMLLVHQDGPGQSAPTEDFEDLFQELDEMGFPSADGLRTVAMANGSGKREFAGRPVQPLRIATSDGVERTFNLRYPRSENLPKVWSTSLNVRMPALIEGFITPLSEANTTMRVFEMRVNTPGVWINDTDFIGIESIGATSIAGALGVPEELPIETLFGPVASTIRDIIASLTDDTAIYKIIRRARAPVAYGNVPAGTSTKFKRLIDEFGATGGAPGEPFIPTKSALGIDRTLLQGGDGVEQLLAEGRLQTPFDAVYFHNRETAHVARTPEVARWWCSEVSDLTGVPKLTEISPTQRSVGGPEFTLTARGVGLRAGLSIIWTDPSTPEEVILPTVFEDGVLRATVPRRLIATIPDCPGGFCSPLQRPVAHIQIGVADTSTGLRLCAHLPLLVEATRVTIAPSTPVAGQAFTATLGDNWRNGCSPRIPAGAEPYTLDGDHIIIDTNGGDGIFCTQAINTYEVSVPIEGLPAGAYQLTYNYEHFGEEQQLAGLQFAVREAIPQIDTLEPPTIPAGEAAFELTVRGSGFLDGASLITWNETPRATEFINASTLRATIPAELLVTPGSLAISVTNEDAVGALASEPAALLITEPPVEVTTNAIPEIDAGSGQTTIVLEGQGFSETSTAYWILADSEAQPLVTRFLDANRLEVDLPAELTATPGAYLLRVIDGESATTTIPVTITGDGPLVSSLPAINGVGHGASFQPVITPAAFASVFGTDFATETLSAQTIPLPYEMGGIRVSVNGIPAALIFVSPSQINFQVPRVAPTGAPALVIVSRNGFEGETFKVAIEADIFESFRYFRGAEFDPVFVHADNQLLTPENPATAGETIIAYGTGATTVNDPPADAAGSSADPLSQCTLTPEVMLETDTSSAPVELLYCGLTPHFVSLAQLNLKLPATIPSGQNPKLVFRFPGSQPSQPATLYLTRE